MFSLHVKKCFYVHGWVLIHVLVTYDSVCIYCKLTVCVLVCVHICSATVLCILPLWPLSCAHAHTHTLKLLVVHSCKSYWFSTSSFLGGSIPVQHNACEHAAENQGTSPFDVFLFPEFQEKKKTLIGVSHREHFLSSNALFSKERCKISFNSEYGLLTKSSFTGQCGVWAYKRFVYHRHCCFQSLLAFTWWFRNVITEQIYDKNCMCIMF